MKSMPLEGDGRDDDENNEEDNRDRSGYNRGANVLAEISKLLADGEPVGVLVAVVCKIVD